MTPQRLKKFKQVAARRQPDLTVVLENVWDPHNVGAVLRSCDSVGIREIFVLNTEAKLVDKQKLVVGKRTSGGTSKWVDVQFYTDAGACFKEIRKKYKKILATHLSAEAKGLYELDLTQSIALLFGNEMLGVSKPVLEMCDGNFIIPQMGMSASLNISVACAVSVYEAFRQRNAKGFYGENPKMALAEQAALLEDYVERHEGKLGTKRTYFNKD